MEFFCHLNFYSVREMISKGMVQGEENISVPNNITCKTCMVSKIHSQPFPTATNKRAKDLLEIIYADVVIEFKRQTSKKFSDILQLLLKRVLGRAASFNPKGQSTL